MAQRPNTDADFDARVLVDPDGCHHWLGGVDWTQGGVAYGRFSIGDRNVRAHRYALERALGRPLALGALACHHCDQPLCVRPDHLYEGTDATNAQDRDRRQRRDRRSGEAHHFARLTAEAVTAIRAEYAAGGSGQRGRRGTITQAELADRYGVSRQQIGRIIRRDRWQP